MNNKLMNAIMVAVAVLGEGCVLEEISNLGDECPNVKYVKLDEYVCSDTDNSDAVCSGFIQAGVFDSQRCPVSYQCMGDEGYHYCECPDGCGTTCCDSRQECRKRDGEAKCVLKQDEPCLSNQECLERDESTPYCEEGACVECVSNSHCKDGKCKNNLCVECAKNSECKDKTRKVCVESKCVECDAKSYSPSCQSDDTREFCDDGVIRASLCDKETPICDGGKCYECLQDENCSETLPHCVSNHCVECVNDEHCPEGSQGCNPKHQCIECVNDADCASKHEGVKPFCSSEGICVECSVSEQCHDNKICNPENNTCVQCIKNDDCASISPKAVCENNSCNLKCSMDSDCPESLFCHLGQCKNKPTDNMNCYNDSQCMDDAIGRVCDTEINQCVECLKKEHCAEKANKACDLNDKKCVACISDTDCPEGGKCNQNQRKCMECISKADCKDPQAPVCIEGVCHACDNHSPSVCKNESTLQSCENFEYVLKECPKDSPFCIGNQCHQCMNDSTTCSNGMFSTCQDNSWVTQKCDGICTNNACLKYQYVRIDDMSQGNDEDAGADIDAVEIWRNGAMIGYAESVAEQSKNYSNSIESTGEHDAVVNDDKCYYRRCNDNVMPFTSLGGNLNYIVYKMNNNILVGDIIRVYEIGGCHLYNVSSSGCSSKTNYTAGKDNFKVSILTSSKDNLKDLGSTSNKGPIIDFEVTP